MSYLALARKWRPRRFEDVLGQPHVVQALSHALAGDRLHPAILLTGTRGVGKTTLARLIAKGLNCETGVTPTPCGKCPSCQQVDEGRFVDLLEIDAASHTGVDNVRELIDNAQYSPSRGRYKVYLIDEVHMLSKAAFNALLKTLEEPPPHVKFILATTDPQKLPITVLSRCLQFNLKRLPAATIRELLARVLVEEKLAAEPPALAELARAADGSMRDGLSLLDQAIAHCGGRLTRAAVEEMLGTMGRQELYALLRAVAAHDAAAVLAGIERLDTQAPDYEALLKELGGVLQRIALVQMLPRAADAEDDAAIGELAAKIPAEDVQLYYEIAVHGRRDLEWAPDPRAHFEMTLLRLLAFRPESGGAAMKAAPAAGTSGASPRGTGAAAAAAPAAPMVSPVSATPAVRPAAAAVAGDAPWDQRVEALDLQGYPKQLARHTEWVERSGDTVRLRLDPKMKHLLQDDRRIALEQALTRQLGGSVRLAVEVGEVTRTPALLEQQRAQQKQQAAESAVAQDPTVRALQEQFGATVRSVTPVDGSK
ncbi:MAG TPA: DNA polymerase III subunit gamma/tau [Candidatus Binatia bacterium]|nr:DNA polymerase III subunit gamma/tau [Candidatus Binatia bacterium]